MREILAENLQKFFDNTSFEGKCTYKGKEYEVWEVSDEVFESMCNMNDEEFEKLCPDGMWRSAEGSNMEKPDITVHINGNEMLGWAGDPWEEDEEDDEFEIYASSLTNYLCDVIGASQPRNVCALAVDLAKYNNMTIGELFTKYEG